MDHVSAGEITAILTAGALFISAIGALIYLSPGKAWRMVVESLEARVANLEKQLGIKDETIRQLNEALRQRDAVIRRLRSIRSVLENLLHRAGVPIPTFPDEPPPEIAPERRTPTVVPSSVIAIDPEE